MRKKLQAYVALTRLNRPVGIYLLLWPTLWSLWLAANGQPQLSVLIVFLAGVVLTRSAGCILNDCIDRRLDAQVARTSDRPLVTEELKLTEALILAAILLLIAFILVLTINHRTVLMSVAALALAASYPWMKRLHHWPQLYLGLTFGWGIPMAWTAQTDTWPEPAVWLLYLANLCWVIAYDTIYALADREDDLRAGIKSTAVLFGRHDRPLIALFQAAALVFLAAAGGTYHLGPWFYLGLAAAAAHAVYQQHLIRRREPENCLRAFTSNAWFGLLIFLGIFLSLPGEA